MTIEFIPHAPNNSIVEAVIGLSLARPMAPSDLRAAAEFLKEKASIKNLLPAIEERTGATINVQAMPAGQDLKITPQLTGVRFFRVRPNGQPDWSALLEGNILSVHCMDYSNWSSFWKHAKRILPALAGTAVTVENPITEIFVRYIDRFTATGSVKAEQFAEPINLESIFRNDSGVMRSGVPAKSMLWHFYSGWFQPGTEMKIRRILNQMNISASELSGTLNITIDHSQSAQIEAPFLSSSGAFDGKPSSIIERTAGKLHDANESELTSLLSDSLLQRIGLLRKTPVTARRKAIK